MMVVSEIIGREYKFEELGRINFGNGYADAELIIRELGKRYSVELVRLDRNGCGQDIYDLEDGRGRMEFPKAEEAEAKVENLKAMLRDGGTVVIKGNTAQIVDQGLEKRV